MSFKHVEVKKKANIYHGGKVVSRTIITEDGSRKTLGVMLPGSYTFNTDASEIIDVTQGHCRIKIAGQAAWSDYSAGASFAVPGQTAFDIEVVELLDYVCHFG